MDEKHDSQEKVVNGCELVSHVLKKSIYIPLEISSTKQGWHMPCTNHFFPMDFVKNQGDANAYFVVNTYVL